MSATARSLPACLRRRSSRGCWTMSSDIWPRNRPSTASCMRRENSAVGDARPPRRHRADHANAVWSWDVTYLPTRVRGQFFYLYLIVDIYSRKIVGHEVFEAENMANSAQVGQRAVLREQCGHRPLVLPGDTGSAARTGVVE